MDYEDWIKQFMANAQKKIPDEKAQEEITNAGAEVLKTALHDSAAQIHHTNHQEEVHLDEDIHVEIGDILGNKNGKTTVGFEKKGHIARFLNDGTKFRKGDHWFDTAREQAKPAIYEAMYKKFKEVTNNDANS